MRLNGWHRLGIVASLGWIAYWALQLAQVDFSGDGWQQDVIVAALYAFVPVALAWLAVWIVLRLTRWVWRGFFPA